MAASIRRVKGSDRVVDYLNRYLQIELTGHKQYLLAAGVCARWGYHRLRDAQAAYAEEESRHAARLVHRILYLEGTPALRDAAEVTLPASIADQVQRDRALVGRAIALLTEAIACSAELADHGSFELFTEMLVDEEHHMDWLEEQATLIDQLGLASYLQQQIRA